MVNALSCLAPCGHTLHCARFRCHRTSGGSSLRAMVSTVKSGCRRCEAKGSWPRKVSVPSRAQAGQTCPLELYTAGSMHPRQYLQQHPLALANITKHAINALL